MPLSSTTIIGIVAFVAVAALLLLFLGGKKGGGSRANPPNGFSAPAPDTDYNEMMSGFADPENINVQSTLWPYPKKVTFGDKQWNLDGGFYLTSDNNISSLAQAALKRLNDTVFGPNNYSKKYAIQVSCASSSEDLTMETSEKYDLSISDTGDIRLSADTVFGIMHGLTTLRQLISVNQIRFIPKVPIQIHDEPRYPYRGLMIDTARNYYPRKLLETILDGMSLSKLNVLHWHIMDAQSFGLEVGDGKLAQAGGYKNNGKTLTYRPEDVSYIIGYAKARGIRVLPEMEAPGHTYSWRFAYPDIVNCAGDNLQTNIGAFGLGPPTGQLNASKDQTYKVINKLLTDMASLFPEKILHVGGDEGSVSCWGACAWGTVLPADLLNPLWKRYLTAVFSKVKELGKDISLWQDVLSDPVYTKTAQDVVASLGPDVTIYASLWRSNPYTIISNYPKNVKIVDYSTMWYLDCGDDRAGWCKPFKGYRTMYLHDPMETWGPSNAWPPAQDTSYVMEEDKDRIVGGAASCWNIIYSEAVTRIFPRVCAIAERLWSPRELFGGTPHYNQASSPHWQPNKRLKELGLITTENLMATDSRTISYMSSLIEPRLLQHTIQLWRAKVPCNSAMSMFGFDSFGPSSPNQPLTNHEIVMSYNWQGSCTGGNTSGACSNLRCPSQVGDSCTCDALLKQPKLEEEGNNNNNARG